MISPLRGLCILALAVAAPPPGFGASKSPVRARQGMVVSAEVRATQAGVEILRKGGNAVDAAVAVGFALAVTHPAAGNLGGGGFMLLRMAHSGETVVIDYREAAPGRASRTMYQDPDGNVLAEESLVGYRASGVPGTVAGLALALENYGTFKLADAVAPALALARAGVELSYAESESMRHDAKLLGRFPETRRIFLRDGDYYREGERFAQP